MKKKFPTKPDVWLIVNYLIVVIAMAIMALHLYPLLMKIVAPMDAIVLPTSLQGIKLSSVLIGVIATSTFSAIPSLARGLAPDLRYIVNRD